MRMKFLLHLLLQKKTMSSYAVRRIGSSLKIKHAFSGFKVLIRMVGHQFWGLCSVHVVSLWDVDGWMWHPRAPIVVLGSSRERKSFVWFIRESCFRENCGKNSKVFAKNGAKIQHLINNLCKQNYHVHNSGPLVIKII